MWPSNTTGILSLLVSNPPLCRKNVNIYLGYFLWKFLLESRFYPRGIFRPNRMGQWVLHCRKLSVSHKYCPLHHWMSDRYCPWWHCQCRGVCLICSKLIYLVASCLDRSWSYVCFSSVSANICVFAFPFLYQFSNHQRMNASLAIADDNTCPVRMVGGIRGVTATKRTCPCI